MKWTYTESFRVRGYEVDENSLVPVQSFCAYMEEAASIHADRLGFSIERLQSEGITWVLARMRMEIYNLPGVGDDVVVKTWPVVVERLQFRRDFDIRDGAGKALAKAVTDWVVVNLNTRKVERIPPFIAAGQPPDPEYALEKEKLRLPEQTGAPERGTFVVRKADIDRNRHVNNVRFIDWILESVPEEFSRGKKLNGLQLIFRAESLYGDTVIARGAPAGERDEGREAFLHSLVRASDSTELVRAKSLWS